MRPFRRARRSMLAGAGPLLLVAALLPAAAAPVAAAEPGGPVINEFSASHTGTDTNEYVEIFGTPDTDFSAYRILHIEGDFSGTATGVVDSVFTPGVTGPTGHWVTDFLTNAIENGSITLLLVRDFTGAVGQDLDTDDDGVLDSQPWSAIADGVAVNDGGTGDLAYATPTLGVAYDGQPFAPGGASRIPDGTDTDTTADWVRNDFDLAGIPGFGGTLVPGEALNTPGGPNLLTPPEQAPSVVSTTPVSGATDVALDAAITVTFSEDVAVAGTWYEIECTSGPRTAVASGGPTTWTLDPDTDFAVGDECTVTVLAANVTDTDTADPPDTMVADHSWTFAVLAGDPCEDPFTRTYAIQGSDDASPLAGATVTTAGVVVGDYEGSSPELRGFYLQDPAGDGDPGTSDGLFVFNGSDDSVALGDLVRVTGTAAEFQDQTQLGDVTSIVICGTGTIEPTDVTLPFDTLERRERYEGMLVELPQTLVVNEHFQLGRFGQVTVGSERHFSPTLVAEPGPDAIAQLERQRLDSLILDDELQNQNRDPILFARGGDPLTAENTLRIGDTVTGVVGVMTYTWAGNAASGNAFRVRPVEALGGGVPSFEPANPRPANPEPIGGDLRVAAMNVLNYFDTLDLGPDICGPLGDQECRGADSAFELERQRAKIVAALAGLDADVVGLMEIENDDGGAVDDLVAALNAEVGAGTYASIDTGFIGSDAIKVALIYRVAAVTPVGAHAILDSSVDPRFIDTLNRPALAQTFDQAGGGRLTVIVNHLKSKGSDCNDVGDPDTGDGSGNCNLTRTAAAEALVDWIASDPTGSGDRDALVIGDLNAYAKEDPIDVFVEAGYTNLIEEHVGEEAYSFVFDGASGYLDHALASQTLAGQVVDTTEWHINADEPNVLDYNVDFKSGGQVESLFSRDQYRSSDHDPLIVGLDLLDYAFDGFREPVDNPPALNRVTAGSAVPVTFELAAGLGLDVLFGGPTSQELVCSTGALVGSPEDAIAAGSSGLQIDPATGEYRFVWQTERSWSGTCRTFEITFDDGTYRTADFDFRR